MTVYAVALAKGGSTKTTTAAEIVAALAGRGRRVLAVDLDQQGNLTTRLGVPRVAEIVADAADLMTGEATAEEAAVPARSVSGAYVIAGTQALAAVEHQPEVATALLHYLPGLTGWDDIVLDTPPALGVITLAAVAAADRVVAPVACEGEAYEQLNRLEKFITARVSRMRPGQEVHVIIPTRHDGRRKLDREVVEQLTARHGERVTKPVREGVAARDSYLAGQPVSLYDPRCGVAIDYAAVMADVLATQGMRA
jgi:chromosome partitioning protein